MIQCRAVPDVLETCRDGEEYPGEIKIEISGVSKYHKLGITFSLGEGPEDLTTSQRGEQIKGRVSWGWTIKREKAEEGELSFTVFRTERKQIPAREEVWILLSGILPMTEGAVYAEITAEDQAALRLPIQKTEPALEILYFEPKEGTLRKGEQAVLFWKTKGAETVRLHPGGKQVLAKGFYKTVLTENQCFLLEAERDGKKVTSMVYLYLYEDSMAAWYLARPERYYKGSVSALYWGNPALESKKCRIRTFYEKESRGSTKAGAVLEDVKPGIQAETGRQIAFEFLEADESVCCRHVLSLKPDESQAILDYTVARETNQGGAYFLRWDVVKGRRIQLFVMAFGKTEGGWQKRNQVFITQEDYSGTGYYREEAGQVEKHYFILRVLTRLGEWKQAAYLFRRGKEPVYYDNLGR